MNEKSKSEVLKIAEELVIKQLSYTDFISSKKYLSVSNPKSEELVYNFFLRLLSVAVLDSPNKPLSTPTSRLKYFENRNALLESEIAKLNSQLENAKNIEKQTFSKVIQIMPEMSKCALKIQSLWRGFKARMALPSLAVTLQKSKLQKKRKKENVLIKVKNALSKINLTLENIYRASDVDHDGIITSEELANFLQRLKIRISPKEILQFIEVIDENCSGVIEQDEFYECLNAYGVATEDQKNLISYTQKVIEKFRKNIEELNINPISLFRECSSEDFVNVEDFKQNIKKNLGMQNREIEVILRLIDLDYSGKVAYNSFINFLEQRYNFPNARVVIAKKTAEKKIEIEENSEKREVIGQINAIYISKFREILKNYGLDPMSAYRFACKANDETTREDYLKSLGKLITNFGDFITSDEICTFLPEVITKETILYLFPDEPNKFENSNENEYWTKRFEGLLVKKGINLQMIFIAADENKDGIASMNEIQMAFSKIFEKELSQSEINLILESFRFKKEQNYSYKAFYNMLKS